MPYRPPGRDPSSQHVWFRYPYPEAKGLIDLAGDRPASRRRPGRGPYHHGMSDPRGVDSSFFHLVDVTLGDQPCQGTACFVARHLDPARWEAAADATPRVYCLGKCYAAPATASDHGRPMVEVATATSVVLERIARGDGSRLTTYTESWWLREPRPRAGHRTPARSSPRSRRRGCAAAAAPPSRPGAS